MNRVRLSTTVSAELSSARSINAGITDAALIDAALEVFLARHHDAELDAAYHVYDDHPLEEPDEWGDFASWRQAAGTS